MSIAEDVKSSEKAKDNCEMPKPRVVVADMKDELQKSAIDIATEAHEK